MFSSAYTDACISSCKIVVASKRPLISSVVHSLKKSDARQHGIYLLTVPHDIMRYKAKIFFFASARIVFDGGISSLYSKKKKKKNKGFQGL